MEATELSTVTTESLRPAGEAPDGQSGQLTPEQVKNWRTAMVGVLGPYALIMHEDQIQRLRNRMQDWADSEKGR